MDIEVIKDESQLIELEEQEIVLKPQEEEFCYLYIMDRELKGNATKCYMKAYNNENMKSSSVQASYLIRKPRIIAKNRQLLRAKGCNPEYLDNKLLEFTNGSNKKVAVDSIKELNRLQGRIVNKNENINVDVNKLLEQTSGQIQEEYS